MTLPNGETHDLPILQSTQEDYFLDIRTLHAKTGLFTFDPGFTCTASCASQITHIDGEKGKLLHRGYDIQDIVKNGSYMELCYLLIYGVLPNT